MKHLTAPQAAVVEKLRKTSGFVVQINIDRVGLQWQTIEVLYPDGDVHTYAMTVHPTVFRNLLSKGVIKYEPQLSEDYDSWTRGWYSLEQEYRTSN